MVGSLVGNKVFNVIFFVFDGFEKILFDFKVFYLIVYMYNFICEYCME